MKSFFVSLIAVFVGMVTVIPEAEAKRLGGGRSFGMQRDANTLQRPSTPPREASAAAPNRAAAAATPQKRSWLGPLAGLAAGLGIAALLSHLGLGEEMAGLLMLALLVFGAIFIVRLLMRKASGGSAAETQLRYAGNAPAAGGGHDALRPSAPAAAPGGAVAEDRGTRFGDFDVAGFERQAKLNFIRLQAASDNRNLDDIRAFTTPEVYAEIAMQFAELGDQPSRTDVVELNAEVLDVAEEGNAYIVSVRFSGMLREDAEAAPEAFREIWHLAKPVRGEDGWRVAGIQQA